ncbi:MAG TPA: hypothetical protein VM529_07010, partial [Gemmata sp.]|nr:hypothetical protein [Gemmata sp.]
MTLPRWLAPGAIAFLVIWLAMLVAGRSEMLRDPGTFWHTTTGEIILADGFLRHDPYTFTFHGTWWVPSQWLGEVAMALAHRAAGFDAQLLGAVTVLAATFAFVAARLLRTGLNPVAVGAVVVLGLAASASHFHVRPHVATMAGLAVTVALLTDFDSGKIPLRRLFWLVPLYVFWVNVHGGVIGGFATVAIATAGWVAFRTVGLPSPVDSRRTAVVLALLVAACGLTALANPYAADTPRVWKVIMGEPVLKEIIKEHRPLDPAEPYSWPVFGVAALYFLTLAGVNWRDIRVTWLLPVVWLVLAAERCRHAPLFALTSLVAVAAMWPHTRWAAMLAKSRPDFYDPNSPPPDRPWWASVWLPAVVVLLAFGLQANGVRVPVVGAGWARHDPRHWPLELLDVLREHEPRPGHPNHLFNDYTDGGFVIYHTPGYRVFVDDRCEVFGGQWLKDFVVANHADTPPAERAAAFARWEREYGGFDFALTRAGTGFEEHIKDAPGWECLKRSPRGAFYRRTISGTQ